MTGNYNLKGKKRVVSLKTSPYWGRKRKRKEEVMGLNSFLEGGSGDFLRSFYPLRVKEKGERGQHR